MKFFEIRRSSIFYLLRMSCPTTIFRRIIAIVIYSINRIFTFWSFSHVKIKIIKRPTPSFAYLNSSTSIIRIFFIVFIITSLTHIYPYFIFGCMAIGFSTFFISLFMSTPTRSSLSIYETTLIYLQNFSTIANTFPIGSSSLRFLVSSFYNSQDSKSFAYKIFLSSFISKNTRAFVGTTNRFVIAQSPARKFKFLIAYYTYSRNIFGMINFAGHKNNYMLKSIGDQEK